jgi:hypothetical protein
MGGLFDPDNVVSFFDVIKGDWFYFHTLCLSS